MYLEVIWRVPGGVHEGYLDGTRRVPWHVPGGLSGGIPEESLLAMDLAREGLA